MNIVDTIHIDDLRVIESVYILEDITRKVNDPLIESSMPTLTKNIFTF